MWQPRLTALSKEQRDAPATGAPAGLASDKAGPSHGEKPLPEEKKPPATKGEPPKTGAAAPGSAKSSPQHQDARQPDSSAPNDPQKPAPHPDEKKPGSSPPKSDPQKPAPPKPDSQQPSSSKIEDAKLKPEAQKNVPQQPASGKPSPHADLPPPAGEHLQAPTPEAPLGEHSQLGNQQSWQGPDFHSSDPQEGGLLGGNFCFFAVMACLLTIPIIAIPLILVSKGSDSNETSSTPYIDVVPLTSTDVEKREITSATGGGIARAGTPMTPTFGQRDNEQDAVCRSSDCFALETLLRSQLNRTADPCEDFYGYVCGYGNGQTASFISKNDVVKKRMTAPLLERATRAMRRATRWGRNLHASCLKFSQVAEKELGNIRKFMASLKLELGDVPEDPLEDPVDRMVQLSLVYAVPVIVSLDVENLVHVEGKPILQASQAPAHTVHCNDFHPRIAGFITSDIKENTSNVPDFVIMKVPGLARFTPGSVSSGRWTSLFAERSGRLFEVDDAVLASVGALRLVDLLVRAARPAEGRMLVSTRLFAALTRAKAAAAVADRVRTALARESEQQRWLKGQQLEQALRMLFDVRLSVGFTGEAISANLANSTEGSFVRAWLDASIKAQRARLKLNRSRVRDELNAFGTSNAVYSGSTRRLVVPVALTEAPIFFAEGPPSYNYGSLGQKRMDSALRNLLQKHKGEGNRGLGGKGEITGDLVEKLAVYYGRPPNSQSGDVETMCRAAMTTYPRMTSTDSCPNHSLCPAGNKHAATAVHKELHLSITPTDSSRADEKDLLRSKG
ncbi:hypothetical protein HPB52_009967 [Rhipicephalus sanguineus]|uniref:Peptidase M13 N-terminal domain-containing protein n=1 Tax=Rhipicephalus sanguineus TaxID=34632 RepID=A0A9D4PR28_RHISA|nr:hypothetical protein HPB52_009967 [Rhipicephalus sanguineus]